MNNHIAHHDFESLIREARLERSMAIGNALANVVIGAGRAIAKLATAITHGSHRTHAANPRA